MLDIASASGAQCRRLAASGVEAVGVDLSREMVSLARRRGGGATYHCASALALPFPDGRFDASLLILALHEHPEEERAAMLTEAMRVTRPGGWLLIADYVHPARAAFHPVWAAIVLVESIAGKAHRAGFRDFVRGGGLEGLLGRHRLRPARALGPHWGTIGLAIVPKAA
ncbi:MAG: class I SAM-dependent methyltransferase [Candidatus Bipolaricaulota bacterium]|nr:MAG: class I SAM-dependent methyltransferase [Candidatus Bipolaricaulota bacterium]